MRVEIVAEMFAVLPYDFESAFARGRSAGIEAVIVPVSPVFSAQGARIAEQVMKYRLPSATFPQLVDDTGFLISYGVNLAKALMRAGDIAASILKGAKAGDIPVEQPTEFEFAVNLKTAKALKISIPRSIILRADRVIE